MANNIANFTPNTKLTTKKNIFVKNTVIVLLLVVKMAVLYTEVYVQRVKMASDKICCAAEH